MIQLDVLAPLLIRNEHEGVLELPSFSEENFGLPALTKVTINKQNGETGAGAEQRLCETIGPTATGSDGSLSVSLPISVANEQENRYIIDPLLNAAEDAEQKPVPEPASYLVLTVMLAVTLAAVIWFRQRPVALYR
jgi:hypothetical protein